MMSRPWFALRNHQNFTYDVHDISFRAVFVQDLWLLYT